MRVMNQFTEEFSVLELAHRVKKVARALGYILEIVHLPNPRVEAEAHYYQPEHTALPKLGLQPHHLTDEVITSMIQKVEAAKKNINVESIRPAVQWDPMRLDVASP